MRKDFNARRVLDDRGHLVATVHENGDAAVIHSATGASPRAIASLAAAMKASRPSKDITLDWMSVQSEIKTGDTAGRVYIRMLDALEQAGLPAPAGEWLDLGAKGREGFTATLKAPRPSVSVFEAATDAIRLSQRNGNAPVSFSFNGVILRADGNSDAEKIEEQVDASLRVLRAPGAPERNEIFARPAGRLVFEKLALSPGQPPPPGHA